MVGRDDRQRPTAAAEPDEGFLGRWSRRKSEARIVDKPMEPDASASVPAEVENVDKETTDVGEPPAFDVKSLPDIDSLGPTSDFSIFMQAGVPAELKTKALRKLWRVKSELANLDGLIDYGEDLTGSFKAVDHLKTAYEVGRGFLRDKSDAEVEEGDAAASSPPSTEEDIPDDGQSTPIASCGDAVDAPGPVQDPVVNGGKSEKRDA